MELCFSSKATIKGYQSLFTAPVIQTPQLFTQSKSEITFGWCACPSEPVQPAPGSRVDLQELPCQAYAELSAHLVLQQGPFPAGYQL